MCRANARCGSSSSPTGTVSGTNRPSPSGRARRWNRRRAVCSSATPSARAASRARCACRANAPGQTAQFPVGGQGQASPGAPPPQLGQRELQQRQGVALAAGVLRVPGRRAAAVPSARPGGRHRIGASRAEITSPRASWPSGSRGTTARACRPQAYTADSTSSVACRADTARPQSPVACRAGRSAPATTSPAGRRDGAARRTPRTGSRTSTPIRSRNSGFAAPPAARRAATASPASASRATVSRGAGVPPRVRQPGPQRQQRLAQRRGRAVRTPAGCAPRRRPRPPAGRGNRPACSGDDLPVPDCPVSRVSGCSRDRPGQRVRLPRPAP